MTRASLSDRPVDPGQDAGVCPRSLVAEHLADEDVVVRGDAVAATSPGRALRAHRTCRRSGCRVRGRPAPLDRARRTRTGSGVRRSRDDRASKPVSRTARRDAGAGLAGRRRPCCLESPGLAGRVAEQCGDAGFDIRRGSGSELLVEAVDAVAVAAHVLQRERPVLDRVHHPFGFHRDDAFFCLQRSEHPFRRGINGYHRDAQFGEYQCVRGIRRVNIEGSVLEVASARQVGDTPNGLQRRAHRPGIALYVIAERDDKPARELAGLIRQRYVSHRRRRVRLQQGSS